MKAFVKLFIVAAVCAFTFFLLMRFAPSTEKLVFDQYPIKWWHVIVTAAGAIAFKATR